METEILQEQLMVKETVIKAEDPQTQEIQIIKTQELKEHTRE